MNTRLTAIAHITKDKKVLRAEPVLAGDVDPEWAWISAPQQSVYGVFSMPAHPGWFVAMDLRSVTMSTNMDVAAGKYAFFRDPDHAIMVTLTRGVGD